MTIDLELLEAYIDGFFGYGDLTAPIWFVGMEEGGPGDKEDIASRLKRWSAADQRPLIDIRANSGAPNKWFDRERPPTQPTWRKLIHAILVAESRVSDLEEKRRYQKHELASQGGAACLLELMPLPAKKACDWTYGAFIDLDPLASRKEYMKRYAPRRIDALRRLVAQHSPAAVIFYGKSYFRHWEEVAAASHCWQHKDHYSHVSSGRTSYYSVVHPASSYGYAPFDNLGLALRLDLARGR